MTYESMSGYQMHAMDEVSLRVGAYLSGAVEVTTSHRHARVRDAGSIASVSSMTRHIKVQHGLDDLSC